MIVALVTALFMTAPTPSPAASDAVRAEVRRALGDADAEVVVYDLRLGDKTLADHAFVVELSRGPAHLDRMTRVRGKLIAGGKSTWLSATVEVKSSAASASPRIDPRMGGPVIVERGDRVTVRVSDKSFRVSADGEALSAGRRGERVSVRVIASNKTLDGRVVEPGVVELGSEVTP